MWVYAWQSVLHGTSRDASVCMRQLPQQFMSFAALRTLVFTTAVVLLPAFGSKVGQSLPLSMIDGQCCDLGELLQNPGSLLDVIPVLVHSAVLAVFAICFECINAVVTIQECITESVVSTDKRPAAPQHTHTSALVSHASFWSPDVDSSHDVPEGTSLDSLLWSPGHRSYSDGDIVTLAKARSDGTKYYSLFRAVGHCPPGLHPRGFHSRFMQV